MKIITPSQLALCAIIMSSCLLLPHLSYAQELSKSGTLPCDELEQEVLEHATPDEIKRITRYTAATPIDRVDPKYPIMAAKDGKEGWVLMSYVVDVEGNVQDPVVEDYEGDKRFQRSALDAIERWKFSPAMKDGKPTEQCHSAVRFDFTMGGVGGASRKFIRIYEEALDALNEGDLEKAQALFMKLDEGISSNRYENAWMSSLDARIAQAEQNNPRELKAVTRAIANSKSHEKGKGTFDENYIGFLYQRKFILEASLGHFALALETSEAIAQRPDSGTLMSSIQHIVTKIEELIASEQHLRLSVTLSERGHYFHSLARKQFTFIDIEGKLDTVEVRCDTHRERFTVAEAFIWSIPETWGKCRVMVEGEEGTSFSLVEVNQA
jgi:TonB family protein